MKAFARTGRSYTSAIVVTAVVASLLAAAPAAQGADSARSLAVVAGTLSTTPVPTISGTAAVGSLLTAKAGTWDFGVTLKYQWFSNGVAISGATAPSITLSSAFATAVIMVKVSGSKPGYTSVTKASAATTRIVVAGTPSVVGTPTVGQQLTVKPGTWTTGVAFRYQWYAGGVAIVGATAATFMPGAAQAGARLSVAVTGTKLGYTTVTKTFASSATVLKATLTAGTAKVTGTGAVGLRLTAAAGTWTSGATLTYQWYVGGVAVSKATTSTYVIRPVDVDRTVVVKVTGSKSGYTTRTVASAATARVIGKVYALCSAMNVDYPDGIRKASTTGDKKSGVLKPFVGTPFVSDTLYAKQSLARDADRDGIMCER